MNVKHSMRNIMLQSTYYAPVTHLLPYYAPITHMLRTNYHIKHLLRTCYAPITDLLRTYYHMQLFTSILRAITDLHYTF